MLMGEGKIGIPIAKKNVGKMKKDGDEEDVRINAIHNMADPRQ